jgi:general secretion pathway protein A
MYQEFFGLRELPFELTPNPKYLFLTPRHREALSNLEYGLSSAKPLTVVIGEAGTGKTTLIRAAMGSNRCRGVDVVLLNNPMLNREEFIALLARRFGLGRNAESSKAVLLSDLERVLRERHAQGRIVALVIDEAHRLSPELLEEIRLLANIETPSQKLLPLVLVGQPELRGRLNHPRLRQLKQRVALRCEILPFTLEETAAYIAARVSKAGGDSLRMFSRDAVVLIHESAGGIPRTISVICDNALLTAFGLGRASVDRATILEVIRDFDLESADELRLPATVPSPDAGRGTNSQQIIDTPGGNQKGIETARRPSVMPADRGSTVEGDTRAQPRQERTEAPPKGREMFALTRQTRRASSFRTQ